MTLFLWWFFLTAITVKFYEFLWTQIWHYEWSEWPCLRGDWERLKMTECAWDVCIFSLLYSWTLFNGRYNTQYFYFSALLKFSYNLAEKDANSEVLKNTYALKNKSSKIKFQITTGRYSKKDQLETSVESFYFHHMVYFHWPIKFWVLNV